MNVARGAVVDEAALVELLQSGAIGGAGVDVYVDEPHVPDALVGLGNVVLLPASGVLRRRRGRPWLNCCWPTWSSSYAMARLSHRSRRESPVTIAAGDVYSRVYTPVVVVGAAATG